MSQTSYAPLTEREETTSTMKHWFFADRVRSAWKRCPSRGRERDPSLLLRPPARAANPPRRARNTSEVPETRGISPAAGAMAVTKRGMAAPTAKLPADANAA